MSIYVRFVENGNLMHLTQFDTLIPSYRTHPKKKFRSTKAAQKAIDRTIDGLSRTFNIPKDHFEKWFEIVS